MTRSHRESTFYVTVGKRAVDLVLGVVAGVVAVPVIAILATVSALSLRTWPFFVQDRVGRDGRRFRFPKIRTLPKTAAAAVDKHEIARIPIRRWSAFLRNTHLDELPQLYCVVSGRMSLVGPRPEMPEILLRYPAAFAAKRSSVRPGCTGLWQVSVDNSRMIYDAPEYDEFYVDHASFALDARILWRTVLSSLSSRFQITLADLPGAARRVEVVRAAGGAVDREPVVDNDLTLLQPDR